MNHLNSPPNKKLANYRISKHEELNFAILIDMLLVQYLIRQ
jgi:hypothetical protein